jgi:hypothetical protein
MRLNSVFVLLTISMLALNNCGGDDGSPTGGGGNGGSGGVELLQSKDTLWLVTASLLNDYCAACDSYTLVWQNKGWALVSQFGDWESTCYGQSCGTKQSPFVLKELTVTPHFDLSAYKTAKLHWTEAHRDYSSVEAYVSPDGGTTWTLISNVDHTTSSSVEQAQTVEVTQYVGSAKSDVRIRFVLVAGTNLFPRRVTGNDTYSCRAEIKEVALTGYE